LVRNHLVAALALGVSGYALGGVFLLEPAPDVALVQILVETLGTVMLMLMLSRMDSINKSLRFEAQRDVWGSTLPGRWRDVLISVVIGGAVALIALTVVIQRPERTADQPISVWHLTHTYSEIKVTDAVGAIVTDFRGTDTLFEIVVFSIAALGVFTLLTPPVSDTHVPDIKTTVEINLRELRHDSTVESPLTRFVARLALIFALMIALSHWLYGGGQPGDGFTAGVIAGLAVSLSYIVRGYDRTRRILPWLKPRRFILAGLILALGNAAIYALFYGLPFLRVVDFGNAPAGLHLSSTALFELAIGVTVFGAVTLIMDTISHPAADENKV
jgi:multisubunit Na+/H+ antiporter MnhB subunit